ncbi:hypothetical protein KKD70_04325 [Patescibacteria group bacterium]|nr:hypothetical protein [Patescibacteria group bacterium]
MKEKITSIPDGTTAIEIDYSNASMAIQKEIRGMISFLNAKITDDKIRKKIRCAKPRNQETAAFNIELTEDVLTNWDTEGVEIFTIDEE